LESHTASSSASLNFTTRNGAGFTGATFQSDYDVYLFTFVGVQPASNADLYLRFSTNGGSSFDSSGIYYQGSGVDGSGGFSGNSGSLESQGQVRLFSGQSNSSTSSFSGTLYLFLPTSASLYKEGTFLICALSTDNHFYNTHGAFRYGNATAVNACQFLYSSSINMAAGTIRCYGIPQ
jgi:hypothetical protein